MAKGAQSKDIIWAKLLEVFPGSFMADAKTLRIPMVEDGEPVEIKVALTAAKDILGSGESAETPAPAATFGEDISAPIAEQVAEPTAEEKENVKKLLAEFGF